MPPDACPAAFTAEVGELGVLHVRIDGEAPRTFAVVLEGEIAGRKLRRRFTTTSCTTAHAVSHVVVASARAALDRSERTRPTPEVELLVPAPPAVVPMPPPAAPTETAPLATITAAAPRVTTPSTSARVPGPPRALRLGFAFAAEGGLAFRMLPRLAGTVGLRVALLVARWRLELAGSWLARQREAADDAAAFVQLWTAEARGAFVPKIAIVEFPLHAGVVVGDLIARGIDVDAATTAHALWGAGMLGAGVNVVPIPRVAIGAEVSGLAAFSRPTFTFGRGDDAPFVVHRPPRLALRALLRVEIRLP